MFGYHITIDKKQKSQKKRKKPEYKKVIVLLIFLMSLGAVTGSYFLAWKGLNSNEGVTVAVITTLLGAICAYCLASFGEKNSRNKYHVDENGEPLEAPQEKFPE